MGCADNCGEILASAELIWVFEKLTDISDCRGDSDFNARVALFCQLTLEEFVQLGVEHSVRYEFPPLGDGPSLCCSSHICGSLE